MAESLEFLIRKELYSRKQGVEEPLPTCTEVIIRKCQQLSLSDNKLMNIFINRPNRRLKPWPNVLDNNRQRSKIWLWSNFTIQSNTRSTSLYRVAKRSRHFTIHECRALYSEKSRAFGQGFRNSVILKQPESFAKAENFARLMDATNRVLGSTFLCGFTALSHTNKNKVSRNLKVKLTCSFR